MYPLSPKEQKATEDFLDENLASGKIHPSNSPQASPFFFVKKKDGGLCPGQDYRCKDGGTAGRTKGVRHTCPEPLKGRGEVRYFTPKGTQGKGGVGRKSKAEGISAGDSPGSDQSARPEV